MIDRVYATDDNNVLETKSSASLWLGEAEIENLDPCNIFIDAPPTSNNPFHAIVNLWEGWIKLAEGNVRRIRNWIPDNDIKLIGTVILLHGYGEHSGRYHHVAKYMCDQGLQVVAIDQKFHGDDSENVGAAITNLDCFDDIVADAGAVVSKVEKLFPTYPYVVCGHDMGAVVALNLALERQFTWKCSGLILSAPTIELRSNIFSCLCPCSLAVVSVLAPGFLFQEFAIENLCSDETVRAAIRSDQRMFTSHISAKFAKLYKFAALSQLQASISDIKLPLFVALGKKDKIVRLGPTKTVFQAVKLNSSSVFKDYDDQHEVLNGPLRDEILSDMSNWIRFIGKKKIQRSL
mmetsp:Transcript_5097/g.6429  ORF Transcript_5097/g.6429 Transcript_5097/m.6429 type:complete len:348 (+) Transcript_5097:348-1391(+)